MMSKKKLQNLKNLTIKVLAAVLLLIPGAAIAEPKPYVQIEAIVTAYTSLPGLTDSTPFTMANGQKVFYGAVANNCYPFGTVVNIMGGEFIVTDRKNKRYGCEWWDILLPNEKQAMDFGIWNNQTIVIF